MGPYNTSIRIAITLNNGRMDYIDIPYHYIPLNYPVFISVNVVKDYLEIYINTYLYKVQSLSAKPLFNNGNLSCKCDTSYIGDLLYLTYTPDYLTHKKIKETYNKSFNEIKKEIKKKYNYDVSLNN